MANSYDVSSDAIQCDRRLAVQHELLTSGKDRRSTAGLLVDIVAIE